MGRRLQLILVALIYNQQHHAVCHEGEVSLQSQTSTFEGGLRTHTGRVEICFNRTYHLICDIGWDSRDAQVACNYLYRTNFSKFMSTFVITIAILTPL